MFKGIGFFLVLSFALLFSIPLACQKNYQVSPLPAPTPTYTISPTPTCYAPPSSVTCANGIMWGYGQVINMNNNGVQSGSYAELLLAINCTPYSTAGVTLTGPGLTLPLPYGNGTIVLGGTTYADYNSTQSVSFITGDTYTLTSVTTSGTAFSSLVMPPQTNIASNGLNVTWSGNSLFNFIAVINNLTNYTYETSTCWSATSPASIPSSAYPSSGNYTVGAETCNYTTSITGGSGIYFMANYNTLAVSK